MAVNCSACNHKACNAVSDVAVLSAVGRQLLEPISVFYIYKCFWGFCTVTAGIVKLFLLFHRVWNRRSRCVRQLQSWGWRLLVQGWAVLCRRVVGIRCHSEKIMASLERGTTRSMLVGSGLFYALGWFGRILLWAEGFCWHTDVSLFFPGTACGSVQPDLFIGAVELFFRFFISVVTPNVTDIFTDVFVLNFVSLASSQQCD